MKVHDLRGASHRRWLAAAVLVTAMVTMADKTTAHAGSFEHRATVPLTVDGPTNGADVFTDCLTADFNRDGRADFACILPGVTNNLIVFVSAPGDSFAAMPFITLLGTPTTIDAAEFGCDRRVDLIAADGDTFIQLLTNDGEGLFTDNTSSVWDIGVGAEQAIGVTTFAPGSGDGPFSLVPGVVGLDLGVSNRVVSRVGEGPGTFPGTDEEFQDPASLHTFARADFNLDGADDIVLLRTDSKQGVDDIRVLLATGSEVTGGIFWNALPAVPIVVAGEGIGVVAGEFNGDGIPDLAVARFHRIDIFIGNGDGTFTSIAPGIPFVGALVDLAVGDLGTDGRDEIVIMVGTGATFLVSVYVNDSTGVFDLLVDLAAYPQAERVMIAPLIGTQLADIAVTNSGAGAIDLFEQFELFDPLCRADLDQNGAVDFADILDIIVNWGPCLAPCLQDIDENGAADFADILAVVINWGPCPGPIGACCLASSCLEDTAVTACLQAGGGFEGHGSSCAGLSCTQLGACCIDDVCQEIAFEACCFGGGNFQGVGTSCAVAPCVIGGCCNGFDCTIETPDDCFGMGGEFIGSGTGCSGTCDAGACCLSDGSCVELTPFECRIKLNGLFQGFGTVCGDVVCKPSEGACCLETDCQQALPSECATLGGTFLGGDTVCFINPCDTGACCFAPNICFELPPESCPFRFLGLGTLCDGPLCPE